MASGWPLAPRSSTGTKRRPPSRRTVMATSCHDQSANHSDTVNEAAGEIGHRYHTFTAAIGVTARPRAGISDVLLQFAVGPLKFPVTTSRAPEMAAWQRIPCQVPCNSTPGDRFDTHGAQSMGLHRCRPVIFPIICALDFGIPKDEVGIWFGILVFTNRATDRPRCLYRHQHHARCRDRGRLPANVAVRRCRFYSARGADRISGGHSLSCSCFELSRRAAKPSLKAGIS